MQCNIDTHGRRIRRTIGIVCATIAIALLIAAYLWQNLPLAIVGGSFVAAAALCLWQAKAGYCVVRGMGLKTPF